MRVDQPSGEILFRETQYFRQSWIWVLLICGSLTSLIPVTVAAVQAKSSNSVWVVALVVLIQLINLACFYHTKLETIISTEGIYYRWQPWFRKYRFLNHRNIRKIEVLKYPHFQYGRHNRRGFGIVNNISGNKGFRIVLTDNKMYYIGSQKINSVINVLDKNYAGVYQYTSN